MNQHKIFFLLSMIILASDLIIIGVNYRSAQHAFNVSMNEMGARQQSAFQLAYRMELQSMHKMATFLAQDPEIQHLFLLGKRAVEREGGGRGGPESAKIRAQLLTKVGPAWDELREQFHIRQFHFHLGPGSLSFLRVHKPEYFGDRMDDVRSLIADTNHDHLPRTGFETGRVYSGLRGAVPVFAWDEELGQKVYVGAMEVGTSFDTVLGPVSKELNTHLAVLLHSAHVQKNMWSNMIKEVFEQLYEKCHCALEASTHEGEIIQLIERYGSRFFSLSHETSRTVTVSLPSSSGRETTYAVTYFPLYDYRALRDRSNRHVGWVFIWNSVDNEVDAFYNSVRNSLWFSVMGFLFVELLLYLAIHSAIYHIQNLLEQHAAALRDSEELLSEAQAVAQLGSWHINFVTQEIRWSEETYRIFSLSPQTKLSLESILQRIDPAHQNEVKAAWKSAHNGADENIEYEIICSPNQRKWVRMYMRPSLDAQGKAYTCIGMVQDITQQKQVEQRLRQNRKRLRDTIDSLPMWVGLVNLDYQYLIANQRYEVFGKTVTEIEGSYCHDILPPHIWQAHEPLLARVALGESVTFEERLPTPQGPLFVYGVYTPVYDEQEQVSGFSVGMLDITAQRQAEQAQQKSETWLRAVFEQSYDGIFVLDQTLNFILVNQSICTLAGYSRAELLQLQLKQLFPRLAEDVPHQFFGLHEAELVCLNGKLLSTSLSCSSVSVNDTRYILGVVRDQTQQKRIECALRQSEARLRGLVESLNVIVWEMELSTQRFTYVSPHAEILLGYPVESWRDINTWKEMIAEEDRQWAAQYNAQKTSQGQDHAFDYRITTVNGDKVWLRTMVTVIKDEQSAPMFLRGIMIDITQAKNVEQQLRTSEQRFRDVLESVPMIAVMLDPQGQVMFCNQYLCELSGWQREEIEGDDWFNRFLPQEVREKVRSEAFPQMLAAERFAVRYENEIVIKNGQRRLIQWYNIGMRNEQGKLIGGTGLGQDITAQRAAENALQENKKLLQEIVDNSGVMVFIQDLQQRFLLVNKTFATLAQRRKEDCLGLTPKALFGTEMAESAQVVEANLLASGEPQSVEDTFTVLGQQHSFLVNKVVLRTPSGEPYAICQVATNITERKKMEQDLRRAKEQAEAANRSKSAFLANMSHELRTPLNAVLGFAQILSRDTSLSEDQQSHVASIHRSGDYLLTLINDILDLAKIEAGRFDILPVRFHLPEFLHALQDVFAMRAMQKNLVFYCNLPKDLPDYIIADEKRLRQILMNLLGNAMKFTEQGEVCLQVKVEGSFLVMSVTDSGIGIAPQAQEQIFEPFQQTGSEQYKSQGTGLGLAISRTLIVMMKGSLTVQSRLNQGSTFTLHLPLYRATGETLPTVQKAEISPNIIGYQRTHGTGALRILIVDDVADNREILRVLLDGLGFAVHQASLGCQAIQLAQTWNPDAMLLDLRMPDCNGLEVTRLLRADARLQHLPIIIISASTFEQDRDACLQCGANHFLSKPVDHDSLLAILEKQLPLQWRYAIAQMESTLDHPPLTAEQRTRLLALAKKGALTLLLNELEALAQQPVPPKDTPTLLRLAKAFNLKAFQALLHPEKKTSSPDFDR